MKINYYIQSQKEIEKIQQDKNRPNLLLHVCCGPCAVWPLNYLSEAFNITILYNNSNIYPEQEYTRRLNELKEYLTWYNNNHVNKIEIVIPDYDNEGYTKKLEPLKDEPERGKRCHFCYATRMKEGFEYAKENHFDYYTTVMTISRQKDSQILNQIGEKLQTQYSEVKYFYSDFKKDNGILKANKIIEEHHMYRQDYCGCIYSYQTRKANEESD